MEKNMTVQLKKGTQISLKKETGQTFTKVMIGLGWDPITQSPKKKGIFGGLFGGGNSGSTGDIDLDASVAMFTSSGKVYDLVMFNHLQSKDGSIVHTGDNTTGEGDGDDEQIKVNLSRVPSEVTALIFIVNSFSGETFNQIENAFCRMVDQRGQEVLRYTLTEQEARTALIMLGMYREDDDWRVKAIGHLTNGKTAKKNVREMARFLS